ncbi:structural maintenance of chromosomes protein 6 [Nematocida sp. AWRm80]|nr:structural maintenance of chromosomes protein 6 [Nematocida sp. AWRm80]
MPSTERTGILKSIKLVNFMCHHALEIEFTKQVSCIVGSNGSGKSAIMIALGVVFGISATAMDRGASFRQYIMGGKSQSIIQVVLSNDSFRKDLYGNKILIEKKIRTEGPAIFKICNEDGGVVSRLQADLKVILEHFRLNFSNPLSFLTQDHSKEFLRSITPKSIYRLFKAGTDLQDIEEEHKKNTEKLEHMKAVLEKTENRKKILEKEHSSVLSAISHYHSLSTIEERLKRLRIELSWSLVCEKELEQYMLEKEKETIGEEISKSHQALDKHKKKITEITDKIKEIAETRSRTLQQLQMEETQAETLLKQEQKRELEIQKELDTFACQAQTQEKRIQMIEKVLNIENYANTKEKREQLQNTQKTIQTETLALESHHTNLEVTRSQSQLELDQKSTEAKRIESIIRQKKTALDQNISRSSPLQFYGPQMEMALEKIKQTQIQVLGPIGMYLQVKNHQWNKAIEAILGSILHGFIVHTKEDKYQLEKLLIGCGVKKYQIYLLFKTEAQKENKILREAQNTSQKILSKAVLPGPVIPHETNSHDTPLTVLSQLEENNKMIVELLIVLLGIERIGLVNNRHIGYKVLRNKCGFDSVYTPEADKIQYIGKSLSDMRCILKDKQLLVSKDSISEAQTEIQQKEHQLTQALAGITEIKNKLTMLSRDILVIREKQRQLKSEAACIEAQLKSTEPIVKDELISEHASLLETHKRTLSQAESIKELHKEAQIKVSELKDHLESLQEKNKLFQESTLPPGIHSPESTMQTELQETKASFSQLEKRISQNKDKIGIIDNKLQQLEEEYHTLRTQALQVSNNQILSHIDTPSETIRKSILTLEAQAEAASQEIPDITELQEQKIAIETTLTKLAEITEYNTHEIPLIEESTQKRIEKREQMVADLSAKAADSFHSLMASRDYNGTLKFNHAKEEIEVRVEITTDSTGNKNSLSGGERSFSGISFILSLWPLVSSPIQVLDEFDVFMDGLNRTAALKLIFQMAKRINSQIILITPLSITDIPSTLGEIITLKAPVK